MTRSLETTVTFRRPFNPAPGDTCQVVLVLPDELAEALAADAT